MSGHEEDGGEGDNQLKVELLRCWSTIFHAYHFSVRFSDFSVGFGSVSGMTKRHQMTLYSSTFTHMLRCMDCEAFFGMSGVVKYGAKYKCRPCHCSYRFVRDNNPRWNQMSGEQRRKAIVANRSEAQHGKARKLTAEHKAFRVSGNGVELDVYGLEFQTHQLLLCSFEVIATV